MKVHEIMTAHARCVAPDNSIVEAAGLMRELDVGVLPVCENDRLAGMVTDRDIVLRAVANGRDAYETTVRDVMSPGVVWVYGDQEVEQVARVMEEKQIRRLPVLNREKRLVGIVSLGDLAVSSNPAFSGQALKEVSESAEQHMRGGRTPTSVRLGRMRDGAAEAPVGTRRVPAGTRKRGDQSPEADTDSRRGSADGVSASAGGGTAAAKKRRTRSRDTTHGSAARAGGAGKQPKRRARKQGPTGAGKRRTRAAAGSRR